MLISLGHRHVLVWLNLLLRLQDTLKDTPELGNQTLESPPQVTLRSHFPKGWGGWRKACVSEGGFHGVSKITSLGISCLVLFLKQGAFPLCITFF